MAGHSVASQHTSSSSLTTDASVGQGRAIGIRLVAMMLLEFVVFGSWFATLGLVLATAGLPTIIANAFLLAAVAAVISPMFLGALGDRFFASQKVLGIAHLLGGVVMLFLPAVVRSGNGGLVLLLIFVYMLFFMPTLGLANSIAFRHLGTNQRLFPYIRVFGTLGWAAAGLLVGAIGLSASSNIFFVTAIASFVLAAYAFTLPATPPPAKGVRFSIGDVVGAKAFGLFRHHNFRVFFVCVLLTSISLAVYNAWSSTFLGAAGIKNVAGVLALGQLSEVLFILVIPWVLTRLGMKWALFGGMVMWGVRFGLFALATENHAWLAVLAICLHGICSDFFLVVGAMYLDRVAPIQITAQAQSLLILTISGLGAVVGSYVSGQVFGNYVVPNMANGAAAWLPMWWLPIGASIVVAVLWLTLFRYNRREELVRWELTSPSEARASANVSAA